MLGPVQYIALSYEDFKELEKQAKRFAETEHTSVEGFYHKSWRVKLPSGFVLEFVGPRVPAGYHQTEKKYTPPDYNMVDSRVDEEDWR